MNEQLLTFKLTAIRMRMKYRKKQCGIRMDADEGRWITTESGKRVHLNEEGEPDKGNPYVIETMKKGPAENQKAARKSVSGRDISKTYSGPPNINSVLHEQGFDGLPQIVSDDEFEKAVQESKFIAQRVYVATSQEVLDEYRNALYDGKWYVECSEGGSTFGQGMYTASDSNGELTELVTGEMLGYKRKYLEYVSDDKQFFYIETMTLAKDARIVEYNELLKQWEVKFKWNDPRIKQIESELETQILEDASKRFGKAFDDYLAWYKSPDASVNYHGTHEEIEKDSRRVFLEDKKRWMSFGDDGDYVYRLVHDLDEVVQRRFLEYEKEYFKDAYERRERFGDIGAYAASLGYDAIHAFRGGKKDDRADYTVILNRTKTIIKDGRNHGQPQ